MSAPGFQRGFILIQAADLAAAQEVAKQFDPNGGDFACGLVPTGSPAGTAPTAYLLSAEFTNADWAAVQTLAAAQFPTAHLASYDLLSAPTAPFDYAATQGLSRPATTLPMTPNGNTE
jgi:hypothetical protein